MDHYFTNNENLKSNIKVVNYSYNEYDFSFYVDNGVFSKTRVDYGSKVLLETYLKNEKENKKVLDLGCGYGLLGIVIAKVTGSEVTMCDVNKRALHLAKMNASENKVDSKILESNVYESINDNFDVIITNPPVRAGKKVLLEFLENAKDHLNKDGTLYYVLRKDHGAKSMQKYLEKYYKITILEKSNGFYIFSCKSLLTTT